ncbi:MAG: hypothetical protein LBV41_10950 [Cytophagaceae bacterium]|jgi:hypothetical protein|nr:hypothetical protein [Cytophagaceae bacterium]
MAACDYLIAQDILSDCDNPSVAGIESDGVIINRNDIDFAASELDDTRKNVVKTIALKTGKRGYKISVIGGTPFNNTQITLSVGTNRNTFINDLAFIILDNSPDLAEKVLDPLANGQFVAVFENKFKNTNKSTNAGDNSFQIMGWYQGLKAQTLENVKYSEDTVGGWGVMIQETGSPRAAMFLFDTSYATTQAAMTALTNPVATP